MQRRVHPAHPGQRKWLGFAGRGAQPHTLIGAYQVLCFTDDDCLEFRLPANVSHDLGTEFYETAHYFYLLFL